MVKSKKNVNLLVRHLHHAGNPHPKEKMRLQISRDLIQDQNINIIIGIIEIENILYAAGNWINIKNRNFLTTSSINIDVSNFTTGLKNLQFGETKFNEPVVIGQALDVFVFYEELFHRTFIDKIEPSIILKSILCNSNYYFGNIHSTNHLYSKNSVLTSDGMQLQITNCSAFHQLIVKNRDNDIIDSITYPQLTQLKSTLKRKIRVNEVNNKMNLHNINKTQENIIESIRYDFIKKCIVFGKHGMNYRVNFKIAESLIKKKSVEATMFNEVMKTNTELQHLLRDDIITLENNQYVLNNYYSICSKLLWNYWLSIQPHLIIKDDLKNYLISAYALNEKEAESIALNKDILKRRLCIQGKPFLYYHIKSEIYDISRDFPTTSAFLRNRIDLYNGNLFKIYEEINTMLPDSNPEVIILPIVRMIYANEMKWDILGIRLKNYYLDYNRHTINICESILIELATALFGGRETNYVHSLNEFCNIPFIKSICDKLAKSDFFEYSIKNQHIYWIAKGISPTNSYKIPENLIFLPFELSPYFQKVKQRAKISFESANFEITYVPKYNTFRYDDKKS
jgi:hypothetical protein